MAVVVSDTAPLHYLILVGQESILERLYGRVFILLMSMAQARSCMGGAA
jgi:hypothetical protein